MQWLPVGNGNYLNTTAILYITDNLDGTPISVHITPAFALTIDPTADPLIAAAFRRRVGYCNLPLPQNEQTPPTPWNPSPVMPV